MAPLGRLKGYAGRSREGVFEAGRVPRRTNTRHVYGTCVQKIHDVGVNFAKKKKGWGGQHPQTQYVLRTRGREKVTPKCPEKRGLGGFYARPAKFPCSKSSRGEFIFV